VLIITRRPKEKLMLGDDVTIHVMEISGNHVRLGVEAPKSVPVYREEIWAAVKQENEAAASAGADRLPRTAQGRGGKRA
jgi:carbon storage regulator